MKSNLFLTLVASLLGAAPLVAQTITYENFIYQIQNGVSYQMLNIPQAGNSLSPYGIAEDGARFELWTIKQEVGKAPVSYLLDHKFVGTYLPAIDVAILSEDSYSVIPRTRADRPFQVKITVNGLLPDDPKAPEAAKTVNLERYVQAYGVKDDGTNIDRSQATLLNQVSINSNGERTLTFTVTMIPGANRAKVRGEERFTAMSIPDYGAPTAVQLASKFIQIWPVADAAIVGLQSGQLIRFSMPSFEIHLNDLYPDSETWAQVYPGGARLGAEGTVIPGSALVIKNSVPQDRVLRIMDWDAVVGNDGIYTAEILTRTPFGLERLDHVTFTVNRTLKVNGNVTTIE